MPCFSNVTGSLLEFFVHPATAAEILADPVQTLRDSNGGRRRYEFRTIKDAPRPYGNGDVQLRAVEV